MPWHSFPADEVHLLAEIVPQLRLRRVAQLGQIALEFGPEKVMELVAIHDDPAAVVLQEGADRPYFAIAANLGLVEDAAAEFLVEPLGPIRGELVLEQRPCCQKLAEGRL